MKLAPWIQTLLEIDMKKGSPIYYRDRDGSSFPGVVLDIRKNVKIRINHTNGNRVIWAKRSNVELQSDNP